MIAYHLWQIYCEVYFQPCDFYNTQRRIPVLNINKHSGGIISVWNPRGEKCTLQKNRVLASRALQQLKNNGFYYSLLWGGNKQMSYKELSAFVLCDIQTSAKLARQNQQLAFYYVDNQGALWLVNATDLTSKQKISKHIRLRLTSSHMPVTNLALL